MSAYIFAKIWFRQRALHNFITNYTAYSLPPQYRYVFSNFDMPLEISGLCNMFHLMLTFVHLHWPPIKRPNLF